MSTSLLFLLIPFALILGTGTSCKKENPAPEEDQPAFTIHSISDLKLEEGKGFLSLSVRYVSGEQEQVQLSLSGVPKGVTAEVATPKGYPTFSTYIFFSSDGGSDGVFPVTAHATSSSFATKFNFNLHLENIACTDTFTKWNMSGGDRCMEDRSDRNVKLVFRRDPDLANRLHMDAFHFVTGAHVYTIYMDLDCYKNKLIIPEQLLADGSVVSGDGSYLHARYTIIDTANQVRNCSIIFYRD